MGRGDHRKEHLQRLDRERRPRMNLGDCPEFNKATTREWGIIDEVEI